MGIIVGLPCSGGSEKDLQLNFGKVMAQPICLMKCRNVLSI